MEKFPLLLRDIELANEVSLELTFNTSKKSPFGFILEVLSENPNSLYSLQRDFPLAPEKEKIDDEMLFISTCPLWKNMGKNECQYKICANIESKDLL